MRRLLRLGVLLLLGGPACAQTVVEGDAWVLGAAGVGTTAPGARLEVRAASAAATVLQVSGVDGTPFLAVDRQGKAALSTTPAANLDVYGIGDAGDLGLQLRSGNLYPATGKYQMLFAYDDAGTAKYRHAITSVHSDSTTNNGLDFLLWASGSATAMPALDVLSLVTTSTGASVHVRPAGTPDADLEVSDGSSTGGGTVHRALEVTPSSREWKSGIAYLSPADEAQAYREVQGLKHARFRYKAFKKGKLVRDTREPIRRGLLYEDAPASIRSGAGALSVNERISESEMALKELIRRLEGAQAQAERLEGAR